MRAVKSRSLPYVLFSSLAIGLATIVACVGDDPGSGSSSSGGASSGGSSGTASSSGTGSSGTGSSGTGSSGTASSGGASSGGFKLTVNRGGDAGAGAITSAPAGIDCGTKCDADYATGTAVTLTAAPAAPATFLGWDTDGLVCNATALTCAITMNAAKNVGAMFTEPKALAWLKTVSSAGGDADTHAALDKDGNIIFATNFGGSFMFGGQTYQNGSIFVAKLAPTGAVIWAKTFGAGAEYLSEVAVGKTGDIAIGGVSGSASVDFGNGKTITTDGEDPFVLKISGADGAAQWARVFTASNDDGPGMNGVAMDGLGNVYVAGHFYASINFNDGSAAQGTANETNTFLVRLASADGSTTTNGWKRVFPATSLYGRKVIVDSANDIIVGGYFSGSVDLDGANNVAPVLTASGTYDGIVAKFQGINGNWVWQKQIGAGQEDEVRSITLVDTVSNDIAVVAYMTVTNAVTPSFAGVNMTAPSASSVDVAIGRMASANGNVLWAKRYGGTGSDYPYDIAVLAADRYVITGYSNANISFDSQSITFAGSGGDGWFAVLEGMNAPSATWAFKAASGALDTGQVVLGKGKVFYGFGKFIGDASILGRTVTNAGSYDAYLFATTIP